MSTTIIYAVIFIAFFCIPFAMLLNLICDRLEKAPMLPPPFPNEPKPVAEFFAQAKTQATEVAVQVTPESKPTSKRGRPFIVTLILCAVFALGGIVGGIGGLAAAGRYQIINGQFCYRIDRLTGEIWWLRGARTDLVEKPE